MNQELINRAHELRDHGFTTGEIANELNVSMETARWLSLQRPEEKAVEQAPADIAINWEKVGGSSQRLRFISMALADVALEHGDVDIVLGIAASGIPFATLMADFIDDLTETPTSLGVLHPNKRRAGNDNVEGTISNNFGSVEGKRAVIVDDVTTSGKTVKEAIEIVKNNGGTPVAVAVLIDKSGIDEIDGIPIESLIKVSQLN